METNQINNPLSDAGQHTREFSEPLVGDRIADAGDEFPLADYLEALDAPHLDIQIARVTIAFMNLNITVDEYKKYSEQLISAVPSLISVGDFKVLYSIASTYSKHLNEKPSEGIRLTAWDALERLKAPDLVSKAIEAFDRKNAPADSPGYHYLAAMGSGIVPTVVPLILNKKDADESPALLEMLGHFRDEAIAETTKWLENIAPRTLKNAMRILRSLRAVEAAASIRSLLGHPDPSVCALALRMLLHFSDPEAPPFLQRAVTSSRQEVSSEAIELAGEYRVREVVPDLLSQLRMRVLFRKDYLQNEKIITALGRIGDASALPHLEELAARSFSLNPKQKTRMTRAIFTSLVGYPRNSIVSLLEMGNQAKDEVIRSVCRDLQWGQYEKSDAGHGTTEITIERDAQNIDKDHRPAARNSGMTVKSGYMESGSPEPEKVREMETGDSPVDARLKEDHLESIREIRDRTLAEVQTLYSDAGSHMKIDTRGMDDMIRAFMNGTAQGIHPLELLAPPKSSDEYAFTHVVNVCLLTMSQAHHLGLSDDRLYRIGVASTLHDVGKLFVPDDIIGKPDQLTSEESRIIESHAVHGARYLLRLDHIPKLAVLGALEHHIKYNGSGYPNLQQGWKTNIVSQMIAISDVFDAMGSPRVYSEPKPREEIMSILNREKGVSFNPVLVDNFLKIIK